MLSIVQPMNFYYTNRLIAASSFKFLPEWQEDEPK